MKNLILISLLVSSFPCLNAQETNFPASNKQTTIYAEVFGQGLNGSVNFDRKFNLENRVKNSYTLGLVYVPKAEDFGDGLYLGAPVSYNFLFGKKNHQLELGVGFTALLVDGFLQDERRLDGLYSYLTPKVGYRFQQTDGGLFFRATFTPMLAFVNFDFGSYRGGMTFFNNVANLGYRAFPWPGASIGWTLKK